MGRDVELACRCGNIRGVLSDASPRSVNRVVCYCDDCQAFLHHLGRAELLDPNGGTDIVQAAPASVSFDRGAEHVTGVRLGPKGMYRWYASCCRTPLGNTMSPALPFIGIGPELFQLDAASRDEVFGRAVPTQGQFAIGAPPPGSTRVTLPFIARTVRLLLGFKLRGRTWPHPFFDRTTGAPIKSLPVLSKGERDALRPLCGPR